jgi:hypothetical protein
MTDNNLEIPPNATIRQEYVKCGNPDCQNQHGPYLYAYWKQDKKLRKLYVGKNLENFRLRKLAKQMKVRPSQLIKLKFIEQEAPSQKHPHEKSCNTTTCKGYYTRQRRFTTHLLFLRMFFGIF